MSIGTTVRRRKGARTAADFCGKHRRTSVPKGEGAKRCRGFRFERGSCYGFQVGLVERSAVRFGVPGVQNPRASELIFGP